PTGLSAMDVNGLAGSVELYLGTDSLVGSDGNFVPVQWKGYDAKLRRYQGEVQERFRAKLEACEADPSRIDEFDWTGIRLVVDVLRSAFHEDDKASHL